jgi:hypothetical protein
MYVFAQGAEWGLAALPPVLVSGLRGAPAGAGAAGDASGSKGDASGSKGDASGSKGCSDAEERVLAFFWCGPVLEPFGAPRAPAAGAARSRSRYDGFGRRGTRRP